MKKNNKKHSPEANEKKSQYMLKNPIKYWKGKKLTKEHKAKIKAKSIFKEGKDNPNWGERAWNYIDGRSKLVSPGRYGLGWKKIRTRILIRDDYTCQHCGKHKSEVRFMDIHHIDSFLTSFDNSLENLQVLCRSCHTREERRLDKIRMEVI